MITKEIKLSGLEYFPKNVNSFTLHVNQIIKEDGILIASSQLDTRAFVPGEIDKVKNWLASHLGLSLDEIDQVPEIAYINAIWTQNVIDAYQDLINKSNTL